MLQIVGPAVQSIIDGQNPNGGWAYGYGRNNGAHTDLSVTGWNVQAVKIASYMDFPFVGVDKCLEQAASYVEKCSLPGGKFAYKVGSNERPSLTGAGAFCLTLNGSKNSAIAFRTMNQIIFDQPNKLSDLDSYAFYYNCQAFAAAPLIEGGIEYSQKWNTNLPSFVLKAQNKAGFWEQGAHFHGDDDGPLFRTLLMLLSLQSEYRYKYL